MQRTAGAVEAARLEVLPVDYKTEHSHIEEAQSPLLVFVELQQRQQRLIGLLLVEGATQEF